MFHLNPQSSFYKPSTNPYSFDIDPDNPSQGTSNLYDLELHNKFSTCRKNLLIFLRNINVKNELLVNFKVIKRYYKMPFDEFPEIQDIMKIFEKITQRYNFADFSSFLKSYIKNFDQQVAAEKLVPRGHHAHLVGCQVQLLQIDRCEVFGKRFSCFQLKVRIQ